MLYAFFQGPVLWDTSQLMVPIADYNQCIWRYSWCIIASAVDNQWGSECDKRVREDELWVKINVRSEN
jgi:hypothetical protein